MTEKIAVAVIGGGPAGILAAYSAWQNGADVTLLERNEKLGKKLYISGKGRCNVTNDCDLPTFFGNVVTNPKFLQSALHKFAPSDTMSLLETCGLPLKVERGNRVFPASDKSSDVIKTFADLLKQCGIKVQLNCQVLDVVCGAEDDAGQTGGASRFTVKTQLGDMHFDKVVVATGGYSYRATGCDGFGYRLARKFGHNIVPLKPALCRILCKNTKSLEGLSLKNVQVSVLSSTGAVLASQFGEMLFTDDGISGPAALTLSSQINKQNYADGVVGIDLKPALSAETLDARILRDFSERMNKDFINSLDDLLPERLVRTVAVQSGIPFGKKVNQISTAERARLIEVLKDLRFEIVGLGDVNLGIVTSGGVDVAEINPSTMESKLVSGLYFCGETLDVDAFTGGFNIQIALSTGFVAGAACAKQKAF